MPASHRDVPAGHISHMVLVPAGPSARPRGRRRALARDTSGFLAAFRAVGASRPRVAEGIDPTRAQRPAKMARLARLASNR